MTTEELITALEQATGPSRELDFEIALAVGWKKVFRDWDYVTNYGSPHDEWFDPQGHSNQKIPAYTASIDAALTLVDGWEWCLRWEEGWAYAKLGDPKLMIEGENTTPAIALCIAALRSRNATRM